MNVLYLVCAEPETLPREIIEAQSKSHRVEVVDLSKKEIGYADLVDKIFASDKVISWSMG